jgi:hypothetical protein
LADGKIRRQQQLRPNEIYRFVHGAHGEQDLRLIRILLYRLLELGEGALVI